MSTSICKLANRGKSLALALHYKLGFDFDIVQRLSNTLPVMCDHLQFILWETCFQFRLFCRNILVVLSWQASRHHIPSPLKGLWVNHQTTHFPPPWFPSWIHVEGLISGGVHFTTCAAEHLTLIIHQQNPNIWWTLCVHIVMPCWTGEKSPNCLCSKGYPDQTSSCDTVCVQFFFHECLFRQDSTSCWHPSPLCARTCHPCQLCSEECCWRIWTWRLCGSPLVFIGVIGFGSRWLIDCWICSVMFDVVFFIALVGSSMASGESYMPSMESLEAVVYYGYRDTCTRSFIITLAQLFGIVIKYNNH